MFGIAGNLMGWAVPTSSETVFGLRRADAGSVKINGRAVRIQSPAHAIRHRMALITEDRQLKGLNLKASVRDNITLASLKKFSRCGQLLQFKRENQAADAEIEKLRIKITSPGPDCQNLEWR